MGYSTPDTVLSPRQQLKLLEVLWDGGEKGWSAARVNWTDDTGTNEAIAVRWNGSKEKPKGFPRGNFGHKEWFILPEELHDFVENLARLKNEYREMARDEATGEATDEWDENVTGEPILEAR